MNTTPKTRLTGWAESAGIGDSMTWVGKNYPLAQAKTDAVELLRQNAGLLEALRQIAAIKNQPYGNDYDEIEEARLIALGAISKATE